MIQSATRLIIKNRSQLEINYKRVTEAPELFNKEVNGSNKQLVICQE